MTEKNYTISMMYRVATHWNVYKTEDARSLLNYAAECRKLGDAHYERLENALLAQHCISADGTEIAFPLKVVERFDAYRKLLKKDGKEPDEEYAEILQTSLRGHLRATNGAEVRKLKRAALGLEPEGE